MSTYFSRDKVAPAFALHARLTLRKVIELAPPILVGAETGCFREEVVVCLSSAS
jgi:hypothetical protein